MRRHDPRDRATRSLYRSNVAGSHGRPFRIPSSASHPAAVKTPKPAKVRNSRDSPPTTRRVAKPFHPSRHHHRGQACSRSHLHRGIPIAVPYLISFPPHHLRPITTLGPSESRGLRYTLCMITLVTNRHAWTTRIQDH